MARQYQQRPGQPRREENFVDDNSSWHPGSASSIRPSGKSDDILSSIDDALAESEKVRDQSQSFLNDTAASEELGELRDAVGDNLDEEDGDEPDEGFYTGTKDTKPQQRRIFGRLTRRQGVAGGIAGLLVGSTIIFTVLFAPVLKLESFLSRINQRAFGYVTNTVESVMEKRIGQYMFYRLATMSECGNRIDINCRSDFASNANPATRLFRTWQDARVEEKLFDRFGFQIETFANPSAGQSTHILKDRAGREVRLGNDGIMRGRNTSETRVLGRDLRRHIRSETKWYEVMQRRSVRKYLSRKHGISSWCFLACRTRDDVNRRVTDVNVRMKYKFVEKFVYPFSSKYGFVMDCFISGGSCNSTDLRNRALARGTMSTEEVNNLIRDLTPDADGQIAGGRTFTQYATEKVLAKIIGQQTSKRIVNLIPVAGQIYFAIQMADMYDRIQHTVEDGSLSRMAAGITSAQYIEWYTTIRTTNDELKSHAMSLEEAGAVMSMFDGAEQSRIYQERYGTVGTANTVSAQENYTCANGEPLAPQEYVCEEKKIAGRSFLIEEIRNHPVVDTLIDMTDVLDQCTVPIPGILTGGRCPLRLRSVVRTAIRGIDWTTENTIGHVTDAVIGIVGAIPGVDRLMNKGEEIFGSAMDWFLGNMFPLPVEFDDPGREKYDGLEAGAELVASEFCQGGMQGGEGYGLGCRKLSNQEAASIMNEYTTRLREDFESSSMFDRLASLDHQYSLASGIVASLPTSMNQLSLSLSGGLAGIFNGFAAAFQRIFSGPIHAADLSVESPFGIPLYGYTEADLDYDPTTLNCTKETAAWEASRTENPETGFDDYSAVNRCLLEEVIADTGTMYFTGTYDEGLSGSASIGSNGGGDALSSGPVTLLGNLAFPLAATKSQVGGGIFSNGDTNTGGHPYISYDIIADKGTQVVSMTGGKVVRIGSLCDGRTTGITVNIPDQGISIWYGHLDPNTVSVHEGQTVSAGTPLARVVDHNVDCSSGVDHLHIDASKNIGGDVYRPGCARPENGGCTPENAARFISIGNQLFNLYEALPD